MSHIYPDHRRSFVCSDRIESARVSHLRRLDNNNEPVLDGRIKELETWPRQGKRVGCLGMRLDPIVWIHIYIMHAAVGLKRRDIHCAEYCSVGG